LDANHEPAMVEPGARTRKRLSNEMENVGVADDESVMVQQEPRVILFFYN